MLVEFVYYHYIKKIKQQKIKKETTYLNLLLIVLIGESNMHSQINLRIHFVATGS